MNVFFELFTAALLTSFLAFFVTCTPQHTHKKVGHHHGKRHKITRVNGSSKLPPTTVYFYNWREFEPDEYPVMQPRPAAKPTSTPLLTPKTRKPVPAEL